MKNPPPSLYSPLRKTFSIHGGSAWGRRRRAQAAGEDFAERTGDVVQDGKNKKDICPDRLHGDAIVQRRIFSWIDGGISCDQQAKTGCLQVQTSIDLRTSREIARVIAPMLSVKYIQGN